MLPTWLQDIEPTLDIGGAVLAILVPLIAYWFKASRDKRRLEEEKQAEKDRQAAKDQREKDLEARRLEQERQEKRDQEYRERQLRYQELKEAVDIHEELTALHVAQALGQPKTDLAAKQFLVALHKRSSARFDALSQDFEIPRKMVEHVEEAFTAIHERWKKETAKSQEIFETKAKQNHATNPRVQERILEFANFLTGKALERGDSSPVKPEFQKLMLSVTVTGDKKRTDKGGQAVFLQLPDREHRIFFSGSGAGELPNEIRHLNDDGNINPCSLASKAKGSLLLRLQGQNASGEQLANAFIEELERLAGTDGQGKCGCGVPFKPSPAKATAK